MIYNGPRNQHEGASTHVLGYYKGERALPEGLLEGFSPKAGPEGWRAPARVISPYIE